MISKNNGRSGAGSRRELCRQRDDWKRAALGMLALSLAGNIALYGAKLKAEIGRASCRERVSCAV